MKNTFPTLYKKSSKGALQIWNVLVEDDEIVVTHGLQDGKKQTDRKLIKEGKNTGKENETTVHEQALFEAESKWKKQLDKGYVTVLEDVNNIVYLPMLAQTFSKIDDKTGKERGRKKYIKYPCIAQRKFDGVRCFASVNKNGDAVLESRKGKQFPHMDHLCEQIKAICTGRNLIVDGELYSDEISFQRLVGLVKRKTLSDGDIEEMTKIKIRVYDCVPRGDLSASFQKRYQYISSLIVPLNLSNVVMVENFDVASEKEIQSLHDQFVQEGFEGIILRNLNGPYALNKRSNDLQKHKSFQDSEFKVVGYESGEGRAEGTIIFRCKTKSGNEFKVRPRGTDEQRRDWFDNGDNYIGQNLTVRYFELTEDAKVPRFPVGICFRSYE